MHRIVLDVIFLFKPFDFVRFQNIRPSRRRIFLDDSFQLPNDDAAHLCIALEQAFQTSNLFFQRFCLGQTLENVFSVDMAQANLCDILRLLFVNAKAMHEVRHNIRVFLCIANDGNCLVDIQQNGLEAVQQVQLFLLLCQIIANGALFALCAPCCPFA